MNEPKIEGEPYTYQAWPCACEGPDGESQIFASEAEVPAGWSHHGKTVGAKTTPAAAPAEVTGAAAKPPKAPKAHKPAEAPAQDL